MEKRAKLRYWGMLSVALLALALVTVAYRYQHPPVFMIYEPTGNYDVPTMQVILHSLHKEAMMETFGLDPRDYTELDSVDPVYADVYIQLGMEQGYKIHEGNTYIPLVLEERDDSKRLILLHQDVHAINRCYFLEKTDAPEKYQLKKIRRAFGTRFEYVLKQSDNWKG